MIKVRYSKVCGRCMLREPLTSGMVGQTIHFEYSHDFDGLMITAVFTDGKNTINVVNPGNECVIPHEVLTTVGATVKVGIYAVKDDELVIPTIYATIGTVLKGADPSGDESTEPSLPVWAQMQGDVGNLNDLTTEAKNNLVAAINEAAASGGGGSQPDWNQNDDTQPDYVKNRPFYIGTRNVTVENAKEVELKHFPVFVVGDTVTVNVDGVEHSLVAYDNEGYVTIGDTTSSIDSGEGQLGWQIYVETDGVVWLYAKEAHTVSYFVEEVVKIDEKYLPPISKQVVYDLRDAAFIETGGGFQTYYFVDPTTLTEILKSMNTGSPMPYIGFKSRGDRDFYANNGVHYGWGTSMDTRAVTVYGQTATMSLTAYIFDTFEHAKEYYER